MGAGPAGLTAAQALAARGIPVLLAEQGPVVGGWAACYACKAATDCNLCGVCLSARVSRTMQPGAGVTLKVDAHVLGIEGGPGSFAVRLAHRPRGVDVSRCTGCGRCAELCPVAAIAQPHPQALPMAYLLDQEACLRARGEECVICREACPFGAVLLDDTPSEELVQADVVVLATGFEPYPAARKGQLGYGRLPGVITTMDLERGLWQHGPEYLSRLLPGSRRVAFVHCVGSRDLAAGRGWCSQVCCPTALRLAGRMVRELPGLEATLFFIDLQRCAPGIARLFDDLPPEIHLVRGIPGDVLSEPGGLLLTFEDVATATRRQELFDLVVLAVGMDSPGAAAGMPAAAEGFLCDLPAGVVAAGACGGPVSIPEAVGEGLRAAGAALRVLESLS
ncbi:MAG: NAD(P)-binding protein [bacterium]|nr:NAD(P)-binding protein [bacterium]